MSTFVLVHGAWHGSWCWKRVRRALQARGHEVFTPTLTGVADRLHLLSPQVDLETHITDVTNLIRWEELADVVLCGHSYGGCVISGVADRVSDRIGAWSIWMRSSWRTPKAFTILILPSRGTRRSKRRGKLERAGKYRRFPPKR